MKLQAYINSGAVSYKEGLGKFSLEEWGLLFLAADTCCEKVLFADSATITNLTVTGTFTAEDQTLSSLTLEDGAVDDLAIKIGADANNGFYGVSDTQLGVAVEGALVAFFNGDGLATSTISEQVGDVGVTIDGALIKDGGISANAMFAGFFPITAPQALSGAGAVNTTSHVTNFTSTGGAQALTLADGSQIGQIKKIIHVVDGGSGVLTPTNLAGGTTITFTTAGEIAVLLWDGTEWNAIELSNPTTLATPPVLA